MPDPLYDSRTARHELPMLFAGQTQKETFVNEAFVRIDTLLHCAIEGVLASPPATPAEGTCWLIDEGAGGAWAGNEGQIAAFAGGNWLFFAPRDGMRLLDRSSGRDLRYAGGWVAPDRPNAPSGGGVVDSEARAAIAALTQCLVDAGIVPAA